jgi:hypothetical protein
MNPVIQPLSLVLVAALAACAQTPSTPATPATPLAAADCVAIEARIDGAARQQRTAEQQQHDAWMAVVPFAVMARYGQAKAAAHESQQRLDELRQHAALRGCAIPMH